MDMFPEDPLRVKNSENLCKWSVSWIMCIGADLCQNCADGVIGICGGHMMQIPPREALPRAPPACTTVCRPHAHSAATGSAVQLPSSCARQRCRPITPCCPFPSLSDVCACLLAPCSHHTAAEEENGSSEQRVCC